MENIFYTEENIIALPEHLFGAPENTVEMMENIFGVPQGYPGELFPDKMFLKLLTQFPRCINPTGR